MQQTCKVRTMLATAAVATAMVPAAHAAPGNLGSGAGAGIAVDTAGTAYIAYNGVESSGVTSLHFCRLPRGAAACERASTLPSVVGQAGSRAFVAVEGSTVRVLSSRYGGDVPGFSAVYLFTSADRGDNFTNAGQVGTAPLHAAAVGPGAGISVVTSAFSGGGVLQRVPTDGSPKEEDSAQLSTTHVYDGAVGLAAPDTPVVTYTDGGGLGKVWRCEACTGGKDPNVLANWLGGTDIGNADDAHMASGPSGLFLKSSDSLTGGNLIVRKYGGGTFGAPSTVPNSLNGEMPQSHMSQDPAGRLHVAWPAIGADAIRLHYATSDDGVGWLHGVLHAGNEAMAGVRTAEAPDHIGLAVWDTGGGAASEVHYLPIGPVPPVAPPPPPPPPPPSPPAPTFPAVYAGLARGVTVSDRGAAYTLSVPRNCVHPGQRFRVTLKWRRKKRKGNLFVKVRRSDFYLGTRRVRIDRRAPYVHTYLVQVTQPRGSTITVRARAFIKMRRGKSPTKSIRARVKVCAA